MINRIDLKLKTIAILTSVVMVCLYISPISHVNATFEWTEYTGEVSLDEQKYVVDAWVINDDTGYEMWYTHGKTALELDDLGTAISSVLTENIINDIFALDFETLFSTHLSEMDTEALWYYLNDSSTVIGYATSSDGKDWNVQNSEVFSTAGDGWDSVGTPCVVKTDGNYEMWYTHTKLNLTIAEIDAAIANMADPDKRVDTIISVMESFYSAIGYATSPDGQTWTVIDDAVLPTASTALWDSVADPSVVKNEDGYEIWYTFAQTSLTSGDLELMMTDVFEHNFGSDNLWNTLDKVSSTIVYATSTNGVDWTTSNTSGLSSNTSIWDSVAGASIVKTAEGYEMWYTHWTTDLTMATFQELIEEVKALKPEFEDTWAVLKSGNYDNIQLELIQYFGDPENPAAATLIDGIKPYLENTATKIGYATSADGITWVIEDAEALVGGTGSLWSSVACPCVVVNDGFYEIWFTQGLDVLNAQTVLDVIQGTTLPIGYASYSSSIDIELVEGWNFIGLPLSPNSSAIEDVLADILTNVETVYAYDATVTTNRWTYYDKEGFQGDHGTLTEMIDGKGYWIKLTSSATLTITGIEPLYPYSINLAIGWNLISIPNTPSSPAIEAVLADILTNVETVYNYDATAITNRWTYYVKEGFQGDHGTLTEMAEGKAYWIKMTAADTLFIN